MPGSAAENLARHHTYIMGILNVTPIHSRTGGRYNGLDAATCPCELADDREGADIPGCRRRVPHARDIPGSAMEEISRVAPVLKRWPGLMRLSPWILIRARWRGRPSMQGRVLINDIWGLKSDPRMGKLIAEHGAALPDAQPGAGGLRPVHNRSSFRT